MMGESVEPEASSALVQGLRHQRQAAGQATLLDLARPGEALRDSYTVFDPQGDYSLTLGYTVVYPGCTTQGHEHDDIEEVYFFMSGEGEIVVDAHVEQVTAGDGVRIPFGSFHQARNTGVAPLTYCWVTGRRANP
jgi:mannose-6-phosphate isomerase-like protein (cupin superfamily)